MLKKRFDKYVYYRMFTISDSPVDDRGNVDPEGSYRLELLDYRHYPFGNNTYRDRNGALQKLPDLMEIDDLTQVRQSAPYHPHFSGVGV